MPRVKALEENIYSLGDSLNTDELAGQIQPEDKTSTEGFWKTFDSSKNPCRTQAEKEYSTTLKLKKDFEDLKELIDLASESQDEALADEIIPELNELEKGYQSQRISLCFRGIR